MYRSFDVCDQMGWSKLRALTASTNWWQYPVTFSTIACLVSLVLGSFDKELAVEDPDFRLRSSASTAVGRCGCSNGIDAPSDALDWLFGKNLGLLRTLSNARHDWQRDRPECVEPRALARSTQSAQGIGPRFRSSGLTLVGLPWTSIFVHKLGVLHLRNGLEHLGVQPLF